MSESVLCMRLFIATTLLVAANLAQAAASSSVLTITTCTPPVTSPTAAHVQCNVQGGASEARVSASADIGVLRAEGASLAYLLGPQHPFNINALAQADASFTDSLTLHGMPLGTSALLTYIVDIQGETRADLVNRIDANNHAGLAQSQEVFQVRASVGGTGHFFDHERVADLQFAPTFTSYETIDGTPVGAITGLHAYTVPVLFGYAFNVGFSLLGSSAVNVQSVPADSFASAASSFSINHSIYWGGVSSVTVNGARVDYTLSSASGADFTRTFATTAVSAVPEPETYALMLVGLGALGFLGRQRRKVLLSTLS